MLLDHRCRVSAVVDGREDPLEVLSGQDALAAVDRAAFLVYLVQVTRPADQADLTFGDLETGDVAVGGRSSTL
jgi:hypothetical protein